MDWLSDLIEVLKRGENVALSTIIATSGSTPAAAFSKMLVIGDGRHTSGTIGGGCMEGDVKKQSVGSLQTRRVSIMTFHLNEHEMVQGLICGGSVEVMTEPIEPRHLPLFERLQSIRDEGRDSVLLTEISADRELKDKRIVWTSVAPSPETTDPRIDPETVQRVHHRSLSQRLPQDGGEIILEPIAGRPRLLIFGGGHVSKAISSIASTAGFRVSVVDDREEYANRERFPQVDETIVRDFAAPIDDLRITKSTYVVIVTRGHRYDEEVLERVVSTPARYIGMIGSKKKVLAAYESLVKRGVPLRALENVHAPMGLEIGAVTAEEIAVSVVAEMIRIRRSSDVPPVSKATVMRALLEKL